MKTSKIIFLILIVLYFIPIVSAGASHTSGIGIVVNGSGNNLTSINETINNDSIFLYDPVTRTAIFNANIFVNENSELIINNQTLVFNCSFPGQYHLETNSNGTHEMNGNSTLIIMNQSHLTAYNPNKEFYMIIRNNSAFTMKDSELTGCGYTLSSPGLNIGASYGNVTDNTISVRYNGIYLNHADHCDISRNDISSDYESIYLDYSSNNTISNSRIGSLNSHAVFLYSSDDITIASSVLTGSAEDIRLDNSQNLRLVNTTYDDVNIMGISSYLHRYWYLDVYVVDSAGNPIQGANATIRDNASTEFTEFTFPNGSISRQTLEQYYQNSTGNISFTPYTIMASKGNYLPQNITISLIDNMFVVFALNTPPDVTLISVDKRNYSNSITNNKTPLVEFKFVDSEQSNASCKICINSSCNYGENSSTQNNTHTDITVFPTLSEGNWSVHVECYDGFDTGKSENWTFYVNKLPEVELMYPENSSTTPGDMVDFEYTVYDNESSLNCTFYNNFTGTWGKNGSQTISPSYLSTFTRNLTEGIYVWNVNCSDGLQSAFAPFNYTIKVDPNAPDLYISPTDVSFPGGYPSPSDLVEITVRVWNNGVENVTNVTVKFQCISQYYGVSEEENNLPVPESSSNYTTFYWTAYAGYNYLTFIVDPDDHIEEFDEDNNEITIPIDIISRPRSSDDEEDKIPPDNETQGINETLWNKTIPSLNETAPEEFEPRPRRRNRTTEGDIEISTTTSTTTTSTVTTTTVFTSTTIARGTPLIKGFQKQLFGFVSGVYNSVLSNPVAWAVPILLLLGLFYLYYTRIRSSDRQKI